MTLRCLGAMALELQHQTPMLLERINSYFGYRAVAQLRLVQGSLRRHPQRKTAKLPPLAPADRAATEAQLRSAGFRIESGPTDEVYVCRATDVPYHPWGAGAVYPAQEPGE